MVENKAKFVENSLNSNLPLPAGTDNYILELLGTTTIRVLDPLCATVILTVNVNKKYDSTQAIRVKQNNAEISPIRINDLTNQYLIAPGVEFTISPKESIGVMLGNNYSDTISVDTEVNFGLITAINIVNTLNGSSAESHYYVGMTPSAFGTELRYTSDFTCEQTNPDFEPPVRPVNIKGGQSDIMYIHTEVAGNPTFTITLNRVPSTVVYDNLTLGTYVSAGTNHLFLPVYSSII
ncbi:MAG: hypothetical protein ACOH2V_00045 [Candidatus Saccharimonadaceae bacterium]